MYFSPGLSQIYVPDCFDFVWCREEFWGRNSNAVVELLNEKIAYILALVEIGEERNDLGIEVEHAVNLLQDL